MQPATPDKPREPQPIVNTPVLAWYACFLVLAIARVQLGGTPCLQLSIHQSIVDSILAGNDWGRQALIGNLEYIGTTVVASSHEHYVVGTGKGFDGICPSTTSQEQQSFSFQRIIHCYYD